MCERLLLTQMSLICCLTVCSYVDSLKDIKMPQTPRFCHVYLCMFYRSYQCCRKYPILPNNIIQIWTCVEGNIKFYWSEATILTLALPLSILLPKFHKTHIAWHHRSIFALLYVTCLWFKYIGLWIHKW